ncbi:dihydrodipicolinate synthase family protein [Paenibacillus jilunlii]|uniref:2-keto-3-deoxy-galactonate aldolase n=1 Tax=Paenibacillus jilunlii TaxID=682956 RepID=A0A1G9PHG8_9BACL|nr:dihydrodipicolinate synthase family protein [Paenibacillus jilunlii]KWX70656.1 2-keto-3-deoxy-galactonate aldolase [Paenibacillus jilunlii]SDL98266.1 4-hydroxy-tetrahydrodipicolinate synthase [Paenibacillus jilunlii]
MNIIHTNAGIIPPVPTILNEQQKFDRDGMQLLIDSLIHKGVHGLFFLGTAGEFNQFDAGEREEIAEFCIDYTDGRLPVWIGTGSNTTSEALRLTRHAARSGATGVVIINPYYCKLSEESLFTHYAAIAEASELPLMLYNFPALTGQDLSPAFVRRLAARYSQVVGIKETVDQLSHIRQMILQVQEVNPAFAVFCGFDEYLLPTLAAGGTGAIAASANFAPQLMLGLYSSFQQNQFTEVLEYHRKLIQIPPLYALDDPFIPAIKEAVRLAGLPVPTFSHAPATPWNEEKERQLKQIFTNAGIPFA